MVFILPLINAVSSCVVMAVRICTLILLGTLLGVLTSETRCSRHLVEDVLPATTAEEPIVVDAGEDVSRDADLVTAAGEPIITASPADVAAALDASPATDAVAPTPSAPSVARVTSRIDRAEKIAEPEMSGLSSEVSGSAAADTVAAAATALPNPTPPVAGAKCVMQQPPWYSSVYKTACNTLDSNRYYNQEYTNCYTGTKAALSYVTVYPGQALSYTGAAMVACGGALDGYYFAKINYGTGTAWVPAFKVINSVRTDFIKYCPSTVPTQGHAIVRRAEYMMGHLYSWGAQSKWGPTFGTNNYTGPYCYGSKRYGFDCAGLAEYAVYAATGKDIGGGTDVQYNQRSAGAKMCTVLWGTWTSGTNTGDWGKGVVPLPGDLIYWAAPGKPTHHVAIYKGWVGYGYGDMLVEALQTGWVVGQNKMRWTPKTKVLRCWR